MKAARLYSAAAVLAIPFIAAECGLFGPCGFESRWVGASGRANEGTMEIASATVDVSATRSSGALNDKSFQWSVTTPSLQGHVTSIILTEAAQPVPALLVLPVQSPPGGSGYSGGLRQGPGASEPNLGGIFEIVAENDAGLEIRTDLPQQPLFSIPLTVTRKEDWSPNCS